MNDKERALKTQLLSTLDNITANYDRSKFYVKKSVNLGYCEDYKNEVKIYKLLEPLGITPKLIAHDILSLKYGEFKWYASYIVLERYGVSVLDKYLDEREASAYGGPGFSSDDIMNNLELFDCTFPSTIFPEGVRKQIKTILTTLHSVGIIHEDVHAGNFLVNDSGIVKVIDFEYTSIEE